MSKEYEVEIRVINYHKIYVTAENEEEAKVEAGRLLDDQELSEFFDYSNDDPPEDWRVTEIDED
jgi:hypothetical protein